MTTTMEYIRRGRPDSDYSDYRGSTGQRFAKPIPRIECANGFSLSVQAGEFLYSDPREDAGPWRAVEVGFPSGTPEPWDEWQAYAENEADPTGTVYGYVPVVMVEALIALHGGEVDVPAKRARKAATK